MEKLISVLPDLSGLGALEKEIFEFILSHWPTNALEIAENFHEDISTREKKRRMSTKYAYYIRKLVQKQLVVCKKAGNSLIVWPLLVEKYRTIHEILKEYERESEEIISGAGPTVTDGKGGGVSA